jgi:broad specificity phosphatase PhoE
MVVHIRALPRATRRALLLHTVPLVLQCRWPAAAMAKPRLIDERFGRLRNHYILLRPGETTFEAAGLVDSNPINKGVADRGLTSRGREQVRQTVSELQARGITSPIVFYDNGARATQTADIVASLLTVPRARMEPEFRWLEARGLGVLDGTPLTQALVRMRELDAMDDVPEPSDDGTPNDSLNEVFTRLRNTILKIETCYSGEDVVLIPGDSNVLSVLAAATCGVELQQHARFTLPPGGFYYLDELVRATDENRFEGLVFPLPSEESIAAGRAAIREMGPRIFSDTSAGSWVLGPGVLR